ncbi:hypothetical protein TSAR_001318 [Trichomalopsis sarcophagae]|uniref:Peptidase S1 domain-containing protein n=1 Tax=Trichomalopsis sarcophagae TaxID=543379 RepID=A0A232EGN6_9HYME|nr:hypothetical protein TSAR_001318 [Trichomalopsis sarcophagae]
MNLDYDSDYGERSIYIRTGSTIRGKGELFKVANIIPETLKSTVLPVINSTDCNTKYKKVYPYQRVVITDNVFCSFKKEEDTCHGYSGGPAVIENQLVGFISRGYDCGGASGLHDVHTLLRNLQEYLSLPGPPPGGRGIVFCSTVVQSYVNKNYLRLMNTLMKNKQMLLIPSREPFTTDEAKPTALN